MPDNLTDYTSAPSSKILDRHGRLLYEMLPPYTGLHSPVPLDEIPLALRQATIAVEDANFYRHAGFDPAGILRSLWANWREGEVVMGGSTITQQLARLLLLSPSERFERTVARKLREVVLAWYLTRHYSKDEILTFYLNEVYYGNMAYGVEAAARAMFGKPVGDLDLAECALLAGLPQAPAIYNPLENTDAALIRQAVVLQRMTEEGYISVTDAEMARQERLYFAATPFSIRAPHFVMYVHTQLEQHLSRERLEAGGLRITTTLDVALNEATRDVLRNHLALLATCEGHEQNCPSGGYNVENGAVVALDPQTGEILAMVGSPDYFSTRIAGAVNATLALRQPGSSIKPLAYAAAFEQGVLTPASVLFDVRTAFPTQEGAPYVPLNYDALFRGPVRVREALASSYNVPAVEVVERIGVTSLTTLARQLGITSFDGAKQLGLAAALGGGEVRLLEETAAYAAFANGGFRVNPVAILRVEDAEGRVLWQDPSGRGAQVLDPRVAFLVSDILSDDLARAPSFGENSVLALSRSAAVKTGTTTDFRDNWTVGYTPDLAVGVWVGNADNAPMVNVTGITGAGPIWHAVMDLALQGRPVRVFEPPEGLTQVSVCALSGQLLGPDCGHGVIEWFIVGTEPQAVCDLHRRIGNRVVVHYPLEVQAWAREQGLLETAVESENPAPPTQVAALELLRPDDGAVYQRDTSLAEAAQRIPVSAEATVGLREVTFWVDGMPLAIFSAPPYITYWTLEPGQHHFSVSGVSPTGALILGEEITITVE
ncbi:MAG: penicillin-binding protein 1C [Anaerolineae bacterium]|nr:penicillin-binding protein 1C [Anaerolineae bacterium]